MGKRLTARLFVLAIAAFLVAAGTQALFSDVETSSGNTFQAGKIDLQIDNTSYYNGEVSPTTTWTLANLDDGQGPGPQGQYLFFNFLDLKPGDEGEDTVSLHLESNPAWACVDLTLTKNDDNTCNEPELLADPSCNAQVDNIFDGELASELNFIFWTDDGDNVLESDESVLTQGSASEILNGVRWTLADSLTNNLGGIDGEPMLPAQDYFIGKAWCFGTLTPQPVAADQGENPTVDPGVLCDGSSVTNASQTDVLMGDVSFYVEQERNNPNFVCGEECFEIVYANAVTASDQGTTKGGGPVLGDRTDPTNALGTPDWVSGTGTNFFSLGVGGFITIEFSGLVSDKTGNDLSFHEATNGRDSYPLENAEVFVSADNITYYSIGFVGSEPGGGGDGVTYLDISNNPAAPDQIKYVKLDDATDYTPHNNEADGYDLDAIDAVYGPCID